MALGDLMGPQAPPPPGNTPSPAQPQGTPGDPGLLQRWSAYLSHPAISSALLQFAASVMQPIGRGSVMGQIGNALADAGGAAGRVQATEQATEQQSVENQQRDRQIAAQEKAGEASASEAELNRGRLTLAQRQQDITEHGGPPLTAKDKADLEVEKERNRILAANAGGEVKMSPQQQIAAKGFEAEVALINANETDPVKAQQAIEAAHRKWFGGVGGPIGPVAPPPYSSLDPNEVKMIMSGTDEAKKQKLIATYGQASIDALVGKAAPASSAATTKETAKTTAGTQPAPATSGGAALDPATGLLDPNMMPPEQLVKLAEEPSTEAAYRKAYPNWDALLSAAKAKIPVKVRPKEEPAVTKEKIKRAGALE